jgi:hypothetical protein
VTRLQAGEAQLEAGEDAALGRTRSLAASLSYGFTRAFTDAERAQLAFLHLFRDTVDIDALRGMGDPDFAEDDAVPQLAGLDRDSCAALLDRAADIGLLESLGGGYYKIHPALPWYFSTLFTRGYGPTDGPAALGAIRAYAKTIGELGDEYHDQAETGHAAQVLAALRAEETNLRHALDLSRAHGLWYPATGCLQGLNVLYLRTGRDSEWARLVAAITPDFTNPATEGPLPGREEQWSIIVGYRVWIAWQARDWPTATRLQEARIAWNRDRAAAALAVDPATTTPQQRNTIRNLAVSLTDLGQILLTQKNPGCLSYFEEALTLAQRTGDRMGEAQRAGSLGNVYLTVPDLRDLDQAEKWYRHSLSIRLEADRLGRAKCLNTLGTGRPGKIQGRQAGS